jgi:hypothetical protein
MHHIKNIKFLKYKLDKLQELTSYSNFLNGKCTIFQPEQFELCYKTSHFQHVHEEVD